MNSNFVEIIKWIVNEQGEAILADSQRLKGYIPISDAAGDGSLARYHDDGSLEVGAPQNDTDAVQKPQINAVAEKIPAAATSSNQLADKSFVNSSISNIVARRCCHSERHSYLARHYV